MPHSVIAIISCTFITLAFISVLKIFRSRKLEDVISLLLNIKKEIERDFDTIVFLDTGRSPAYLQFEILEDLMEVSDCIQEILKGFQYEMHNFVVNPARGEVTFLVLSTKYQEKKFNFRLTRTFSRSRPGISRYYLSSK